MPKLYEVEVQRTVTMMVLADDEYEAEEVALDYADEEADNDWRTQWETVGLPREVKSLTPRSEKKFGDAIPWSAPNVNEDEKTVSEILAEINAEAKGAE